MNCLFFSGKMSRYFIRCLAVHIPDNLSIVSWHIISIYFWAFRGELSWYFVQRIRMNYLDTWSKVSQKALSTFCLPFHGELSWYFVQRLRINYLESSSSQRIFSVCCRTPHGIFFYAILSGVSNWYCWHRVGRLTVGCLGIFSKSRIWDNSIILRAPHGKLSRFVFRASHSEYSLYFFGCLTSKYLDIL